MTISSDTAPIIVVAGPTASGKSALAIDIAKEWNGVVINADSMQVYEELAVVTARPDDEEMGSVPHRLFGCLSVAEACSAGRWLDLAAAEIETARAGGQLPVVCGGTGMYLKALEEGLAPIPDVPEDIRAEIRALHSELGGEAFHARLATVDAEAAAKLSWTDSQRCIRAFEVVQASGRTQAEWAAEPHEKAVEGRFLNIVLTPDREVLYPAINDRFDRMMDAGAMDEVRAVHALKAERGLSPDLPALKAVGVRELLTVLDGDIALETAVEAAKQASRNYAKRQMTWIRTQIADPKIFSAQYSESLRGEIFSIIRQFLLT